MYWVINWAVNWWKLSLSTPSEFFLQVCIILNETGVFFSEGDRNVYRIILYWMRLFLCYVLKCFTEIECLDIYMCSMHCESTWFHFRYAKITSWWPDLQMRLHLCSLFTVGLSCLGLVEEVHKRGLWCKVLAFQLKNLKALCSWSKRLSVAKGMFASAFLQKGTWQLWEGQVHLEHSVPETFVGGC